jgi:hypothetical protein
MSSKRVVWSKRMRAWERSGQTRVAFCRAQRLSLATFDYWRCKLRAPSRDLVPVVVSGVPAVPVEIVLPNGVRLRMAATDVAHARAWVQALSC